MNCPIDPLAFAGGDTTLATTLRRDWQTSHQTTTPEPHFITGYTGHTPGYDEHKLGQTYGHCNSEALKRHRVAGARLSRIPGDPKLKSKIVNEVGQIPPRAHPHETLQPHFLPGYTGFTPGSGIKRAECVGDTYGRVSHVLLSKHKMQGARLRPMSGCAETDEAAVKFYCYEHELTRDDIRRFSDQVPGYTGHVPRAAFRHGKTKTKITEQAIAEFQQIIDS